MVSSPWPGSSTAESARSPRPLSSSAPASSREAMTILTVDGYRPLAKARLDPHVWDSVDGPRLGKRLRDMRNGFAIDPAISAANLDADVMALTHDAPPGDSAIAAHALATFDQSVTWSDLAWLRSLTRLPILVKGLLTAEDARLAMAHGAAGVVVSNHGGRQLDAAVPALHALPEVVDAVGGTGVVLLDGG